MISRITRSDDCRGSEVDTVTDVASPTSHQAAHRVFSTTELLCKIIAQSPLKDVFIAAAVCRDWREAIAAEPTIQHALFLKPKDVHEVIAEDVYIVDLEHPIPMQKCNIIGEVNPWASDICGYVHKDVNSTLHPSINMEFLHHGGLWREMFVTQPPCKIITVNMHSWPLTHVSYNAELKREAGIKMGELFDFIDEEMRYHPDCRGSKSFVKDFDTEKYSRVLPFATTRCKVRNGEVRRPAQLPQRPFCPGFEHSHDFESDESDDWPTPSTFW